MTMQKRLSDSREEMEQRKAQAEASKKTAVRNRDYAEESVLMAQAGAAQARIHHYNAQFSAGGMFPAAESQLRYQEDLWG